jgi:hypothetical protein
MGAEHMSPALKRSELLRGGSLDRLDAEFFDSERIEVETRLEAAGGLLLGAHADISEDRVPDPSKSADDTPEFTYVEIRNVDQRDGFVHAERAASEDAPSRARMALRRGMVGLSSVRPIRSQVFVVTDDLDGGIGTTGFILLKRTDDSIWSSELLFTSLKTRHVTGQLDRRARASMYPTLHPPDVCNVVLPPVPRKVADIVQQLMGQAEDKRREFLELAAALETKTSLYFNTMDPAGLMSDLGHGAATTRQLADLKSPDGLGRLDAEFHAVAFDKVIDRITAAGSAPPLGTLLSAASTGASPSAEEYSDADPGGGTAVIKVGSLTGVGITWAAVPFAPPEYASASANRVVAGDIVFTSTAHQPKYMAHKVDVVCDVPAGIKDRLSFVGDLMRLRIRDQKRMPPHYVAAFLRNPLGKEQIRRCIRGISSHVYPEDVRQIVIPIPPPAVAKGIAEEACRLESTRWGYTRLVGDAINTLETYVDGVIG